ncbi:type I DNA topoisomerase [Buchnera aphidicola]|uniref:type I DNA topoisomerase n=1 Tax=Buchnera aphidicola TaxID=9 RepID=UPI0030EDC4DC
MKKLVIVESPTKAKTIGNYLGKNYIVKSSYGHIRDLPSKTSKKILKKKKKFNNPNKKKNSILFNKLGIDPNNNWNFKYNILPGKEKLVKNLKKMSKDFKYIYLATDLDREGESIAWHLKEVIKNKNAKFIRVKFNEITKNAILSSFKKEKTIDINKVHAQKTRRFMDRIVGYMVSPLLWKKISRGLSAGRVQSAALRLITERELKIKQFILKKYWKVYFCLFKKNFFISFNIIKDNLKTVIFKSKKQIKIFKKKNFKNVYYISKIDKKIIFKKPLKPFITSTLQRFSLKKLNFNIKKTMLLAQKLYELGYITYMRTDSTHLSKNSIKLAKKYIVEKYGKKYVCKKKKYFLKKKLTEEAHEAIRPSKINQKINLLKGINKDGKKLYLLIKNRFLMSQMSDSIYYSYDFYVKSNFLKLFKNKKILLFKGWQKINKLEKKKKVFYNKIKVGDILSLKKIKIKKFFTRPMSRFNEGSLVKKLESLKIGRPSTYSTIINNLNYRGYVELFKKKFYAQKIGEIIVRFLKKYFFYLIDYKFTAKMEKKLDKISNNKIFWKIVLDKFYKNFLKSLKIVEKKHENNSKKKLLNFTSIKCKVCSKRMVLKIGVTGVFLGCSGYSSLNKNRCKYTKNLISEIEFLRFKKFSDKEKKIFIKKKYCKKCNFILDNYIINKNKIIKICYNYPFCNYFKIKKVSKKFSKIFYKLIKCFKCKKNMIFKGGKFGKFFICKNKKCKNIRKILKDGKIDSPKITPILFPEILCKNSNTFFVLREGISGLFFAAYTFPKSRETRAPFIEELLKFKKLLPKRIKYLSTAPIKDNKGNKTILKFDKKTKQQFVTSINKKNKKTNLNLFFIDGKWK